MTQSGKGFDRTIWMTFIGFIALGLPEGLLGLAWPSIRQDFNLPLDAIGAILLAGTLGFMITSFNSGALILYLGAGRMTYLGFGLRGAALLAIFAAPSWEFMVLMGFVNGVATGALDAGLNTYVAGYGSTRLLNWLHACFGLGATISPLVMTELFAAGYSWRVGYAFLAAAQFTIMLLVFTSRGAWHVSAVKSTLADTGETSAAATNGPWQTLRLPIVWIGITIFILYAGLEVSAGQWSYTLFTESREVAARTAGLWVSIYWGSFTWGRFFFGFLGDRFRPTPMLRVCMAGMIVGAALVWFNPSNLVSFIGLAILGFWLAPVFPLLIATTGQRMSARHAAYAIGFQVGAASVGIATLPWLAGFIAKNTSLEAIGPFLAVIAVILFALHEILVIFARRRAQIGDPIIAVPSGK